MGQHCSCIEKTEEVHPKIVQEKPLFFSSSYRGNENMIVKSQPLIQTLFENEENTASQNKYPSNPNIASSTHLRQSIFGEAESQTPHKQEYLKILSERQIIHSLNDNSFDIDHTKPQNITKKHNTHYPSNTIKLFDSEPNKPDEFAISPDKNKLEEDKYPIIRAVSLKKMASIELLPQVAVPSPTIPLEANAVSIEMDEGIDRPSRQNVKEQLNQVIADPQNFVRRRTLDRSNSNKRLTNDINIPSNSQKTPTNKNKPSSNGNINTLEGIQIIHLKDGGVYEGEVYYNLPHGKGIEKSSNNDYYEGNFCRGIKSGYGKMNMANGNKYRGNFENNKFNGTGTLFFLNGDSYIGEFKNGVINGIGTYNHNDGKVEKGFWRNGELIDKTNF